MTAFDSLATKADITLINQNIETLRKDLKIQVLLAIGSISVFLAGVVAIATAVVLHFIK